MSEHDADPQTWAERLGKYHDRGVLELVAFDPEAAPGQRLRVWDRIDGDHGAISSASPSSQRR